MARTFLVIIISLMALVKVSAQDNDITVTGTHFELPADYKNWQNSNSTNFTVAQYKEYNGTTYITLVSPTEKQLKLTYLAEVKKGSLTIEIEDTEGNQLNTYSFSETGRNDLIFGLEAGKQYKIKFRGTILKVLTNAFGAKYNTEVQSSII